jgi:lysophospholipase L1-like esterase
MIKIYSDEEYMKTKVIGILGKLLLLLASTICALVIAEVSVRVFFPKGNEPKIRTGLFTKAFWETDELLGWRQLPNAKSKWKNVPVVINSKGLRDKEYDYERKSGITRMLVLGDSFVWGWGVKLEDMFTKIIERQNNNLEVISMGIPGYSTDQEFLWLKEEGLKYKPDILLLLINGHDFSTNLHYMYDGRYKPMFILKNDELKLTHVPVPDLPVIRKIHLFLGSHSYLYMFLYNRELTKPGKILYEKITGKSLMGGPNGIKAAKSTKTNYKQLLTLAILKKANELCKKNKIQLIIAEHFMQPEYTKSLEDMTKENDIYFINLENYLTEFTQANPGKKIRLGKLDTHWNPLGHKIVAQAISDYLTAHQLLPKATH